MLLLDHNCNHMYIMTNLGRYFEYYKKKTQFTSISGEENIPTLEIYQSRRTPPDRSNYTICKLFCPLLISSFVRAFNPLTFFCSSCISMWCVLAKFCALLGISRVVLVISICLALENLVFGMLPTVCLPFPGGANAPWIHTTSV